MKEKTKKLKIVLFTGYNCNNRCVFCIDADKRALPERTTKELLALIYAAGKQGADILEIIGGEATIRPDFTALVRAAKKVGIASVVCATNGRVLADLAASQKIVDAGLDAVIFSIHGPSAGVHDALTASPGSFDQLMKGMANLKKLGFRRISGNTTVVKSNMRALPALAGLYVKLGVRNVEYIFVDPTYGGAKNAFDELVPKISAAAPYIKKALRIGLAAGLDQWKARYVPLCHFKGYETQISEINERTLFLTEHWAPDFKNTDAIGSRRVVSRRRPPACAGCARFQVCEGLWVEYLNHYGDGELKAVKSRV
ncbi:MAG: radical SAM protein [Elusimicrobia bacterium]|nr:radical SAM protein [Elusimicrobiota bacterium]